MTENTKQFIENNITLINENEFEELYGLLTNNSVSTSDFTLTLYDANIDPTEYMTVIPYKFLYKSHESVAGIKIPSHIKAVKEFAFYETDLLEIDIPEGVEVIFTKAFGLCKDLMFVSLPHSIEFLDRAIFIGCNSLSQISYNGTLEEWDKIDKYDKWLSPSRTINVKLVCTDGERWIS